MPTQVLNDAASLQMYIEDELNIQMFTTSTQEQVYNIKMQAEGNSRVLGKRLKGDARKVCAAVGK